MKHRLILIAGLAVAPHAGAAISIPTASSSVSENFDTLTTSGTLSTWTDDSTLPGWYSNRTMIAGTAGAATSAGLYSLGPASGGTDRALGAIPDGSNIIQYAVALSNGSGNLISGVNLAFNYEQWRQAVTVSGATLSYAIFNAGAGTIGGSYTAAPTAFNKIMVSGTATSLNGNLAANQTAINSDITGLAWGSGQELWLRWEYTKSSGGGLSALGIDDLTITAIPEPSSTAILGAIGALALLSRRRI